MVASGVQNAYEQGVAKLKHMSNGYAIFIRMLFPTFNCPEVRSNSLAEICSLLNRCIIMRVRAHWWIVNRSIGVPSQLCISWA